MSDPTQVERVVAAAGRFKGVCRIDFQLPDVIDGGDPILNFPGRMYDAEKEGHSFEVIGKRNRCKVFRLIEAEGDVEEGRGGGTPEHETRITASPAAVLSAVAPTREHKPMSPYEYEREVA